MIGTFYEKFIKKKATFSLIKVAREVLVAVVGSLTILKVPAATVLKKK